MRLRVDWNEVYDDDYVWTSVSRVPFLQNGEISLDRWVLLYDINGDTCWGRITAIQGPIVSLLLDWSSWRHPLDVRLNVDQADPEPVAISSGALVLTKVA